MGGVVKSVKKIAKEVERGVKKTYDITNKLLLKPVLVPARWALALGKVALQGKSFKKTFAKELEKTAKVLADIYDIVGNKWLGINDERFLGIKDKNLRRLGKVIKDVLHDDAIQTVGFGIVALAILVTLPISNFAGKTAGEFVAGAIGNATAGTIVDFVVDSVVSLGIGYLLGGLVDAAKLAIYGDEIKAALKDHEDKQEALKVANLSDILSGAIFDKMAGGYLYASQFAGNKYYDATKVGNCNISVGGEFNLSPHCIRTNIGYVDTTLKNLAGDDSFSVVNMTLPTDA